MIAVVALPLGHCQSSSFLLSGLVILLLMGSIHSNTSMASPADETGIPTYMISTRDVVKYEQVRGPGYGQSNYSFSNITELLQQCPDEVVIFVHGWNVNENKSKERLDRLKMSLEHNNYYNTSLVGFSWRSDTEWDAAKSIAKWNGPRLADFIFNLMQSCKEQVDDGSTKIRIIGHSMGARVILSSLDSLNKNSTWNNNNFTIASVHFLGAAVDDEEVSKYPQDIIDDLTNWGTLKSDYGVAIEEEVVKFYNLFNPEDNVFQPNPALPFSPFQIYPSFEGDLALGFAKQLIPINRLPANYNETNVQSEISAIRDADGIKAEVYGLCKDNNDYCQIRDEGWDDGLCHLFLPKPICQVNTGDNHAGYIGFRNSTNTSLLASDGAINKVVDHWDNNIIRLQK